MFFGGFGAEGSRFKVLQFLRFGVWGLRASGFPVRGPHEGCGGLKIKDAFGAKGYAVVSLDPT